MKSFMTSDIRRAETADGSDEPEFGRLRREQRLPSLGQRQLQEQAARQQGQQHRRLSQGRWQQQQQQQLATSQNFLQSNVH